MNFFMNICAGKKGVGWGWGTRLGGGGEKIAKLYVPESIASPLTAAFNLRSSVKRGNSGK
jgi:hypothetical protein